MAINTFVPIQQLLNSTEKNQEKDEDILRNYTTPGHPTAYSGLNQVYNFYGGRFSQNKLKTLLAGNEGYTLHKEFHQGPRNITYKHFKRYQFQIDLVDVQQLAAKNDGYRYLFNCIDIFTRFAFVRPLKDKKAETVLAAFKSILQEANKKPFMIVMDKGTEFTNQLFQTFCQNEGMKLINPQASVHAAFIERFNRTLQMIMYKYMSDNETERYIDVLQLLVDSYNKRKHRIIHMSPIDAEKNTNNQHLQLNLIQQNQVDKIKPKQPSLRIGTYVRIAKQKGKFSRSYDEQTVQEIFRIRKVDVTKKIPLYYLSDYYGNEDLVGGFYDFELTPVKTNVFRVEKVLKKRNYKGKKQIFVKWKGFSEKYNSWIDEENIEKKF